MNIDLSPLQQSIDRAVQSIAEIEKLRTDSGLAFSEAKVTQMLGLKPTTLRDLRLSGELRGKKVGRSYVYLRDDLIQFLAS